MDAVIVELRRAEPEPIVKDGRYSGTWGGYCVIFETPEGKFIGRCSILVRGPSIPCIVEVENGKCRVETVNQ